MIDLRAIQDLVNALAPYVRSCILPLVLAAIVPTLLVLCRSQLADIASNLLFSLADFRHLANRLKYDHDLKARCCYRRALGGCRRRWRR